MISTNLCPHCSSTSFTKYGKYRNSQRYKCKDCYRTFNEGTGLIWYNSRKSTTVWDKYCELMLSGYTIRQCASMLDICIETSFNWRHKILKYLNEYTKNRRPSSFVAIKHTKFKENFKGQKIPPVTTPISERENIRVLTSVNQNSMTFSNISFKGNILGFKELSTIKSILKPLTSNKFIAGNDGFSVKLSNYLNKNKTIKIARDSKNDLLVSCNLYLAKIREWLSKFRSVATKYLNVYLHWFVCIYEGLLFDHTSLSNLISTIFCIKLL